MNSQFNKGILELLVLAMIHQEEVYGYELVQRISKRIEISEGTIYPILRRLVDEGQCETYLKESSEGPPRKYYRMTSSGRQSFRALMKEWRVFISNVDHLLKESGQS